MRPALNRQGRTGESGSVIFFIIIAIVLIALVTVAIRNSGIESTTTDTETNILNITRVKQYASELERGVTLILSSGISEADIRFAHGDASADYGVVTASPNAQLFNPKGGGVEYKAGPEAINFGNKWEFYGHTALPGVGSDKADLVAVLPNVREDICTQINKMEGYDPAVMPTDSGGSDATCMNGGTTLRFNETNGYPAVPNTVDDATFTAKPATEGCAYCTSSGYYFFHVLHAR